MSRQPDLARRPELLQKILSHLLDKPLASLSFRTVAKALGVSPFTLVYHFGTRAELVNAIVEEISERRIGIQARLETKPDTLEIYFDNLASSWQWMLLPRNRQLQRLEFEAAMLEAIGPKGHRHTRALYDTWRRIGNEALKSLGVSKTDAEVESRLLVDTFYGIQLDLIINHAPKRASAAFERAMEHHRERIESLVALKA